MTRYPSIFDKGSLKSLAAGLEYIVVEKGLIAYFENSADPRDSGELYECTTLPAFMRRYFARRISLACTIEMAKLGFENQLAGKKLSGQEFVKARERIEALLTASLEAYLRSASSKCTDTSPAFD